MSLIPVMIGGVTKYNKLGQPYNEGGSSAIMDTDQLDYKTYTWDNENETGTAHEYWEGDQLRHRSVDLKLKTSLSSLMKQGDFS